MQKRRILTIILLLAILVVWRMVHKDEVLQTIELRGTTMGPIPYSIKYIDHQNRNFQSEVDSILNGFNQSLSTYIPDSEISLFNKSDSTAYQSPYLYPILAMSQEIYENSEGAYDPSIGPLINAWGFGPDQKTSLDSAIVDSILNVIGFDKVVFDQKYASKPLRMELSFSASAKGYGIDVVADFLRSYNIINYMIEIGGEVTCSGKNIDNHVWKIGIEKPKMSQGRGELFATVFVKNRSLATSGNYRNYYLEEDRIIAHTISPFTGYPTTHNLLSASIFANNCTLADGYATACMVLGLEKSIDMVESLNGIDAYFIYSDENGNLKTFASSGIQNQIEKLN